MAGDKAFFNKAMNDGHSAAWDQSWQKAASYYRLALKEFPDDPKALTSLALAMYETGDFDEALIQYQRAAQVSPEDPIPFEKVADLLEKSGRVDQAVETYMRSADLHVKNRDINKGIDLWNHVVLLNPEMILAYSRLAMIYERVGRKAESIRSYLIIAAIFQHHGDVPKAIQVVNRALQVQPDSPDAAQALSMIKMGRMLPRPSSGLRRSPTSQAAKGTSETKSTAGKDRESSIQAIDPVADARQKAIAALASLVFELMEDSTEDSGSGIESILRGGQTGSRRNNGAPDKGAILSHLNEAISAISAKQENLALEELDQAVEAGLNHTAVMFVLGCLMIDANRFESGIRHLQRLSSHPDYGFAASLLLGQTLLKMNRRREAAESLMLALRSADLLVTPPEIAMQLEEAYDPLIEAYQQSVSEEPSDQLCQSILSLLLRPDWQEQMLRARQQLPSHDSPVADLITEAGGSEIVGLLSNIQRLARVGKHRTAMEEAYHALSVAPTYLPLHVTMGEILLNQGMTADAVKKFQATANTYAAREETGRAVTLFRRVIKLSPLDLDARLTLIEMLKQGGLFEEAVQEYVTLADTYYTLADLPKVRSTLAEAFDLAHDRNLSKVIRIDLLSHIADIEMQSLEWRQALSAYEQIRVLNPEDEATRQTIVDLHFRLRQSSQAVTEITDFTKFMVEKRKIAQIVEFLEKLVAEYPEEPVISRQLGDAYRQTGRTEEALARYDAAAEEFLIRNNRQAAVETIMAILALNPPNAAEYQQMLSQLR